jgi:hypothetical protein
VVGTRDLAFEFTVEREIADVSQAAAATDEAQFQGSRSSSRLIGNGPLVWPRRRLRFTSMPATGVSRPSGFQACR